jgi:hypothetical protein
MKKAISILSILIVFPIRVYLMYYVLTAINATELPMFIFWASIPFGLLVMVVSELLKKES